jgi:hypothetical protein
MAMESGRRIRTLATYSGKVFYGYGDYTNNAGSIPARVGVDVAYYDPTTGGFGVSYNSFRTEEINTFRTINGALHVPAIDPAALAKPNESVVSNRTGTWALPAQGVAAAHVFDVATSNGTDLLLSGAAVARDTTTWSDARGVVWRSTDGGDTWTESLSQTDTNPAYRDGYERIYWMGQIGNHVYTQASQGNRGPALPMMRFDGTSWSKVTTSGTPPIYRVNRASKVLSAGNRIFTLDEWRLVAFDGTRYVDVPLRTASEGFPASITLGDNGMLYVFMNNSTQAIVEVDPVTLATRRSWTNTTRAVFDVTNLAVLDGQAYLTRWTISRSQPPHETLWRVAIS